MRSSSVVLPWSTWPSTATTGGRSTRFFFFFFGDDLVDEALGAGRSRLLPRPLRRLPRVPPPSRPFHGDAKFFAQDHGRVMVDAVRDGGHDAVLHQDLDQVDRAAIHERGKIAHGDVVLNVYRSHGSPSPFSASAPPCSIRRRWRGGPQPIVAALCLRVVLLSAIMSLPPSYVSECSLLPTWFRP